MPSHDIRTEVTQKIIQALESSHLPWRRPWKTGSTQPGRHSNIASKKPYTGLNPMLLEIHAIRHGLLSRWWGTFAQWRDLGCRICRRPSHVEEGHWGCQLVFWKPVTKTVVDSQTGEEEDEKRFVLRTFTVFSADQVEGEIADNLRAMDHEGQPDAQPDFAPAEELILATKADIRFGGSRAYYRRPTPEGTFPHHTEGDFLCIPPKATFDPPGAFYETAVHELAHWSEVRTGFDHEKNSYALGEMVAEIASCYVSAELGIPMGEDLGNHAAYLRSWLDGLKGDRNFIFKAAKQASKVTDFLLGFVKKPDPVAVAQETVS